MPPGGRWCAAALIPSRWSVSSVRMKMHSGLSPVVCGVFFHTYCSLTGLFLSRSPKMPCVCSPGDSLSRAVWQPGTATCPPALLRVPRHGARYPPRRSRPWQTRLRSGRANS